MKKWTVGLMLVLGAVQANIALAQGIGIQTQQQGIAQNGTGLQVTPNVPQGQTPVTDTNAQQQQTTTPDQSPDTISQDHDCVACGRG